MAAGVAFGADSGAEDDEVFGDAWVGLACCVFVIDFFGELWWRLTGVDNVHGTHGAAGVVENPFLVEVHVGFGRGGL